MRKKGKKVIRPAGDELMDYLNRGFAICNRCGAVMKNHTMQCFDCLERLGYPIEKFLKEQEKES